MTSLDREAKTQKPTQALIDIPEELTEGQIRHDFDGDMAGWTKKTFGNNPADFGSTFSQNNVSFENGILKLKLEPKNVQSYNSVSGEYFTLNRYGYGYYEVRMKPAKGNIMAGSFFTYTGPSMQKNHHEIDFEFIKDSRTGKMVLQTNFFVEGRNNEKVIDLPFDPSEDFHTYSFYWSPDRLYFFVDGKLVRSVLEDESTEKKEIPYKPGQIMMNIWAAGPRTEDWLGKYDNLTYCAQYDYVRFIPYSEKLGQFFDKYVNNQLKQ